MFFIFTFLKYYFYLWYKKKNMEENTKDSIVNNQIQENLNPPPPAHMLEINDDFPATYIEIVTEKDNEGQPISVLEVDLIISREKGKETRKLSMNFAGIDFEKKEMIENSISLDRDSFEVLKKFFTQLDWNS